MSNRRQGLVVIERGGQRGCHFGQQLLLFLEVLAFRDVSQRYGEDGLVADLQLGDRSLRRKFVAVLASANDGGEAMSHGTRGHRSGRKPLDVLAMSVSKALGHEIAERS